ncbi:Helix-turn-helix transcriptional regulator [Vibrio chagasii]|jgi:DNA-binding XRE family transcriptional regulator|uniref:helix-turn-helix domain-containing protein n=1 Tax=Vibrio TaxID=662 RepID=UPI0010BD4830|nr:MULTISPECIES: helix-turn-helix transcriptional regulator [Vibrio]MCG9563547.1 helix-turn-helix domain-containing protein [Vibrio chagasii]MDC5720937.1 helix-turn-helix domain-containing protein [Vibrio europaeus]TKE90285.1 helix-turn-helix transcriptional regulator [Vibrio sp. F12]CAH6782640.1 Helix-turn-helix transcriptional regulator [Vibrio chagasii]CAH6798688.1 Helix-turn-helix transcriptional regulator [Vibrio chagasii]
MERFTYENALLNRTKAKFGLTSEYQLAKKLNVDQSTVRNWRNGRNSIDWKIAFHIASLIHESDQNLVWGLIAHKIKNDRVIKVLEESRP